MTPKNGSANGRYGPYKHPAVATLYGPPKSGKSSAANYCFAGRLAFIGAPGGDKPSVGFQRYPIPHAWMAEAKDTDAVYDILPHVRGLPIINGQRPIAALIDDASVLTQATYDKLKESGLYPNNKTFQLWDDIKRKWAQVVQRARYELGLYVIFSCHLDNPGKDTMTGIYHPGGPKMPGKSMRPTLPFLSDLVARHVRLPDRFGPWKGGWHVEDGNPNWIEGDRHGVLHGEAPDNLYETLRAAQYPIPRPVGLEWMEEFVVAAQVRIGATEPSKWFDDLWLRWLETLINKNVPEEHAYWAVRDAFDRYTINRRKNAWMYRQ